MMNMDKHNKNGIISMTIWIAFLIILFGSYLYVTQKPISYFLDEETGGFISGAFFLGWALIWFGIGRHYSLDYDIKKQHFITKYQEMDKDVVSKIFKKAYLSKIARMLSVVFFVSVPFYVAANVKDTPTLRNCIFIGIFMVLSIIFYGYYKKNSVKENIL